MEMIRAGIKSKRRINMNTGLLLFGIEERLIFKLTEQLIMVSIQKLHNNATQFLTSSQDRQICAILRTTSELGLVET